MQKINDGLEALDSQERKLRKLNIIVKGLPDDIRATDQNVQNFIKDKFSIQSGITAVKLLDHPGMASVTLSDWQVKMEIMKKKSEVLGKSKIFIDHDLTPRERKIKNKLQGVARAEKKKGRKVVLSHQKVQIDGNWFKWNDISNKLFLVLDPQHAQGSSSQNSRTGNQGERGTGQSGGPSGELPSVSKPASQKSPGNSFFRSPFGTPMDRGV